MTDQTIYLKDGGGTGAIPLVPGETRTGDFDGYWNPSRPDDVHKVRDYIDVDVTPAGPDPFGPDVVVEIGAGWQGPEWIDNHSDWKEFLNSALSLFGGGSTPPDSGPYKQYDMME